jgi:hypothetical protein
MEEARMDRAARWERVGAATGIAFVVFMLASFLVIPDGPPALDDPIGKIKSFYVDNSSEWQASAYLTGIAAFFFLWFTGSLQAALQRAEERTEGGVRVARIVGPAAAVTLALVLFSTAISDALATRVAAEADQAVIRALYDVQAFVVSFATFTLAAFTAATAVVSYRARLFPPLVTWLGLALVPAWLINGFAMFTESGAFSPTGAVGFVVLLVWVAWVIAVSASLMRRAGVAAVPDTA